MSILITVRNTDTRPTGRVSVKVLQTSRSNPQLHDIVSEIILAGKEEEDFYVYSDRKLDITEFSEWNKMPCATGCP